VLGAQAFAQWVLAYEPLELCHDLRVTAEAKIGFDAQLERFEALFLEPRSRVLHESLESEVGERRAPPERESRSEELSGALWSVGGKRGPTFVHEPPEAKHVDALGVDLQRVPAP
jgi:hypothetical protein